MRSLIKAGREKKGLLISELAGILGIDAALVSKFESGARKPTKVQVYKIAQVLDLDADELMVAWLKEKILFEVGNDDLALRAMIAA
jgi:transcriptional regulator with XRE-family HTH domain